MTSGTDAALATALLEQPGWPDGFVVAHQAAGGARGSAVIIQPFAEEQKAARRALVELARHLAAAGYEVRRPDLFGTGDSRGAHGEADLDAWLTALRADSPGLRLGLRLGASLAWLAGDAETVVLIEPIVNGASYLRQCRQRSALRAELTLGDGPERSDGEGDYPAFDFDGFAVSGELHRQLAAVDLLTAPVPRAQRALILQVSGSGRIKKPLEDLAVRAREGGAEVVVENVAVEPFWSSVGIVDTAPVREAVMRFLGTAPAALPPVGQHSEPTPVAIGDGVTARVMPFAVAGTPLTALLYEPAQGTVERLVVLLHGWSGYRIGPGRLLTEAARELARSGYAALSFDFRGRGDSAGDVAETTLQTMIADAVAIVPAALEATGAATATLLGLCSGSEVAVGAGLSDSRIDSLVLWSAPIFGGELTLERRARRGRTAALGYLRKVFRAETWAKLVGGRLNWKLIRRALSGGRSTEAAAAEAAGGKPDPAAQMRAFDAFAGRMLLVYGTGDPEAPPSREFYLPILERAGIAHGLVEIEGANHNFYALGWKRELMEATIAWLAEGGAA